MLKYLLNSFIILLLSASLCYAAPVASRDFDGTDDEINYGAPSALNNQTDLSVLVWVNLDQITSDQNIFSNDDGTAVTGSLFFFDFNGFTSGNDIIWRILINENTGTDFASIEGATNSAKVDTWQWVAFTFTAGSATGLHLYYDNVEDPNSPVTTADLGEAGGGGNSWFAGERAGATLDMNGQMAYAQAWNRVLTLAELNEAANCLGRIDTNAQIISTMWGDSPERDLSGNGNNGVVTGAGTSQDGPPISLCTGGR